MLRFVCPSTEFDSLKRFYIDNVSYNQKSFLMIVEQ